MEFEIRKTTEEDLERVMQIYEHARAFMAEHGNPNQWGPRGWPPQRLIEADIASGDSYVCTHDIDPTYRIIEDGAWIGDDTYGVVHRIASDGSVPGIGTACIEWAYEQCGHLRIDTHEDNDVMQNLLAKCGFVRCGIIHVVEDDYPRIAFERI